jgi:signal transduction histidine kinase
MQATPLLNRNGELLGVLSTLFVETHRPTERDLRMTDLFARQAADAIENKQQQELIQNSEQRYRMLSESLEQKVQDRSRLLKFLHDIVSSANEAATVEGALRSALQLNCTYLRCSVGHVWLLGEEGQELVSSRIWYQSGQSGLTDGSSGTPSLQRLSLNSEPLGSVFRTGKPLWLDNPQTAQYPLPDRLKASAVRSVIVLPISNGGKVFAACELFGEQSIPLEPEFREIVPSISTQIGHVFERKQLEREVAQIADHEQQRMGEELHDGLSQQLAAIALLAGGLSDKLKAGGSPLVEKAENLQRAAEDAKRQCRALTKGLIPVEVTPDGLMHALRDLAERTEATFGIECEFHCAETVLVANSFVATHLYKIAAEAVHNAVKHALAKKITITLQLAGGVQVMIEDDGRGLPVGQALAIGDGLRIAHHRAGLIGAQITLRPSPRGGALFTCTVSN